MSKKIIRFGSLGLLLWLIFTPLNSEMKQYDSNGNEIKAKVDLTGSPYQIYSRIIDTHNSIQGAGWSAIFGGMQKIELLQGRLEEMANSGDLSAQIYAADIELNKARVASKRYSEFKGTELEQGQLRDMNSAYQSAIIWLKLAAKQGHADSAYKLAGIFANGQGVNQSFLAAVEWYYQYSIDSFKNDNREAALHGLEKINELSPNHALAKKLNKILTGQKSEDEQGPAARKYGTAFYISPRFLITNNHVVDGCSKLLIINNGKELKGTIKAQDSLNDLALVQVATNNISFAPINPKKGTDVGSVILVAGYPLQDYLSNDLKITTGIVNANSGVNNDPRYFQISAQVQPGNSGGPLIDEYGNVTGVVVSKLDAVKIAEKTGDIPQNINFAIKGAILRSFLEINGIEYIKGKASSKIEIVGLAKQVKDYVSLVSCQ